MREARFDRLWRGALGLAVVMLVAIALMVGYLVIGRWSDTATLSDQKALQERQDCARVISNEQTAVKDARDNASDELLAAFVSGLIRIQSDPAASPAVTEQLKSLSDELEVRRAAVSALTPTQKLVDRRCPSV